MARLYSCGFELNSITLEMTASIGGSPAVVANPVNGGKYAMQSTGASSGNAKGKSQNFVSGNQNGPYFFRIAFTYAALPTIQDKIIVIQNATPTSIIWITIDNLGVLRLFDEDGQIGSASPTVVANTRHFIEIQYDRTPAAGSQVVRAKLNGTEFAGSATRDLSTGIDRFGVGQNLGVEAQSSGNFYFDDLAVNDNTGSYQNSYPGDGIIIHQHPNGDGDNTAWTNGWANVDEESPNTADIISSGVNGAIEDMTVETSPAAIKDYDIINLVAIGVQWAESVTTNPDPTVALRVKAAAAGTVLESSAISLTQGGAYRINSVVATPNSYLLHSYVLPSTATPWSKAKLDTAQIGVRLTNAPAVADQAQVSALWMLVEYLPAVIDPVKGAIAFGEASPSNGETVVSYQTFDNGAGALPGISGDPDYGKLSLAAGSEARSRVYEHVNAVTRKYTLQRDVYGTGSGSATLQIRGSTTPFLKDDNVVSWTTYTAPIIQSWRYVQIRVVGI